MTKSTAYLMGFISVLILLGCSFYIQHYQGINPCPLCLLQRFTIIALGFVFLLGIFCAAYKGLAIIIGSLSGLISLLGIMLSGRQVWLQHFPSSETSNCDASLQYMLQVLPFTEVAKRLFQGNAECTQVDWQFLHLSLAKWSLICFIFFLIFSLWQLRGNKRPRQIFRHMGR